MSGIGGSMGLNAVDDDDDDGDNEDDVLAETAAIV